MWTDNPVPNYGQDAPGVRLGMAGIAVVGLLLVTGSYWLPAGLAGAQTWIREIMLFTGACAFLYGTWMAAYMTWSGIVGKLRARARLLDRLETLRPWIGDELVLDVGCGRGLMAVGVAKRLRSGQVIGVDLWRSEDLAGNSPQSALANAAAEGVAERIRIETGDARQLPLHDATVDVVVSRWVLHNFADESDRARALDEIWRVLRPGGAIALADIAHVEEYRKHLVQLGAEGVQFDDGGVEAAVMGLLSGGTYRPQAVVCRKRASVP